MYSSVCFDKAFVSVCLVTLCSVWNNVEWYLGGLRNRHTGHALIAEWSKVATDCLLSLTTALCESQPGHACEKFTFDSGLCGGAGIPMSCTYNWLVMT